MGRQQKHLANTLSSSLSLQIPSQSSLGHFQQFLLESRAKQHSKPTCGFHMSPRKELGWFSQAGEGAPEASNIPLPQPGLWLLDLTCRPVRRSRLTRALVSHPTGHWTTRPCLAIHKEDLGSRMFKITMAQPRLHGKHGGP